MSPDLGISTPLHSESDRLELDRKAHDNFVWEMLEDFEEAGSWEEWEFQRIGNHAYVRADLSGARLDTFEESHAQELIWWAHLLKWGQPDQDWISAQCQSHGTDPRSDRLTRHPRIICATWGFRRVLVRRKVRRCLVPRMRPLRPGLWEGGLECR